MKQRDRNILGGVTEAGRPIGEKLKGIIHEQDGYFLIICDNCNKFIKGISKLHVLANIKIHQESLSCEEEARARRILAGSGDAVPKLKGTLKQKLAKLEVYKTSWFYEEMKEELEKE